jgi:hypothetical protein
VGFKAKHEERDRHLPMDRQKLIEAIERDLIKDHHVIAIFYGGSIGNENTDVYSDIDLRVVVKDEVFEEYRLNKKKRASQWGNVLFYEDFPWTNYSVAHFDNFIKVDTFYYQTQQLEPSVWLKNIKIVFDPIGMMKEIHKKSNLLTYTPSLQEIELWRTKCFAYFHETYRRMMRKELYYALHCVDNLRLSMIAAWYMEAGIQPNTFGDWARLEGERSKLKDWQLALLESWSCGRDPEEIQNTMESMVPEFKRVYESLCGKVGIDENSEWVDEIINKVL